MFALPTDPCVLATESVLLYKRGGGKKFIRQQKQEGSSSDEKRPTNDDRSSNNERENDRASNDEREIDEADNGDASSGSSRTIAERQNSREGQNGDKAGKKKEDGKQDGDIESADAVFTWKDLTYVRLPVSSDCCDSTADCSASTLCYRRSATTSRCSTRSRATARCAAIASALSLVYLWSPERVEG